MEAQTSSAMEGTYTTADKLVLAESGATTQGDDMTTEVVNYSRALSWCIENLPSLPLSGRMLKQAHKILLSDVGRTRGENKYPGEYKRDQNMIGGLTLETARFIPPPPSETVEAMGALETYINRADKSDTLALIDLAIAHYQFESIHPFADGNGRLGRMLVTLMALTEGLLDIPALYVSPELESRKSEYIDLMYAVSARGEWENWISFFLETLSASCLRAVNTIDHVIELQIRYREAATTVSRSNNILAVIDMLFDSPVLRPGFIVNKVGITDAAARNLIKQLENLNIIEELPGLYPKVWWAPELIKASAAD